MCNSLKNLDNFELSWYLTRRKFFFKLFITNLLFGITLLFISRTLA